MAKIKIRDLPKDVVVSKEELKTAFGGTSLWTQIQKSTQSYLPSGGNLRGRSLNIWGAI